MCDETSVEDRVDEKLQYIRQLEKRIEEVEFERDQYEKRRKEAQRACQEYRDEVYRVKEMFNGSGFCEGGCGGQGHLQVLERTYCLGCFVGAYLLNRSALKNLKEAYSEVKVERARMEKALKQIGGFLFGIRMDLDEMEWAQSVRKSVAKGLDLPEE